MGMDAPPATALISSNLKVSEAACVDAIVWMHGWMRHMRLPDPFLIQSQVISGEAAFVDAEV
jgi:hypothetical protein